MSSLRVRLIVIALIASLIPACVVSGLAWKRIHDENSSRDGKTERVAEEAVSAAARRVWLVLEGQRSTAAALAANAALLYTDEWYKANEETWLRRALTHAVRTSDELKACLVVDASGKVIAWERSGESVGGVFERSFAGASWLDACVREPDRGVVFAGFTRDGGVESLPVGRGSIGWAAAVCDGDGNPVAAVLAVWGMNRIDEELSLSGSVALAHGIESVEFGLAEGAGRGVGAAAAVAGIGGTSVTRDIGTGTGMTVVAYFTPAPRGANAGMVLVWGVVGALVVGLVCGGVAAGVSERSIVERAKRLQRLVQADGGVNVRHGAMRLLDSTLDATEAALIERRAIFESTRRKVQDGSQRAIYLSEAIADLADEANLVALNASIEAAKAGEGGRVLGALADEVRRLATRTSDTADEISNCVRSISEPATSKAMDCFLDRESHTKQAA